MTEEKNTKTEQCGALSTSRSDEIFDVRALVLQIWQKKLFILLGAIIGAAYGFNEIRNFQPMYTAYMVVQSAPEGNNVGIGSQLSGMGGIASLVGVNFGGGKSSAVFERFKILVGTVTLAEHLNQKHDLLKLLYASAWDESGQKWKKPSGKTFEWKQAVYKYLNMRTWQSPDINSLANYLSDSIKFEEIGETSFVKILYKHRDPELAKFVLESVFKNGDQFLRQDQIKRHDQKKRYLWAKLSTATNTEFREALLSLLISVEKSSMLMTGDLPYVAERIEPVQISSEGLYTTAFRSIAIPVVSGASLVIVIISLIILFKNE